MTTLLMRGPASMRWMVMGVRFLYGLIDRAARDKPQSRLSETRSAPDGLANQGTRQNDGRGDTRDGVRDLLRGRSVFQKHAGPEPFGSAWVAREQRGQMGDRRRDQSFRLRFPGKQLGARRGSGNGQRLRAVSHAQL